MKHVLDALKPYLVENGGVIKAEHIVFVEGRGNLMLEYCPQGANGGCGLACSVINCMIVYLHKFYYMCRYCDVHW